jgi:hypothetical protein
MLYAIPCRRVTSIHDERTMKNESLDLYLNDHLAGSVGALELFDRRIRIYEDRRIAGFCRASPVQSKSAMISSNIQT